jgi:protein SCO1/2
LVSRAHAVVAVLIALVAVGALSSSRSARAENLPPGLVNVGVTERLGNRVPQDVVFRDHTGRRVVLGDLLQSGRPVVLNMVYHSCPSSCSLVLDGVTRVLARQDWTIGEEVTAITVSIDPRDTPEAAARRRARALREYGRDGAGDGWHFLVAEHSMSERELLATYGANPTAERLSRAIGFRYQWKPHEEEYAHPAVTFFLTPDGRVARYLYGLEYRAEDVRMGLLEASEGRSVSTVERVMIYCYRYDPSRGEYVVVAENVMKLGGALVTIFVLGLLAFFWRRELGKREPRDRARPNDGPEHRLKSVRS